MHTIIKKIRVGPAGRHKCWPGRHRNEYAGLGINTYAGRAGIQMNDVMTRHYNDDGMGPADMNLLLMAQPA
jgi:hypothetical protein